MSQKRMFSKQITESDSFLNLSATSQNLYFHLNMNADDDGFVNSPKRVMRNIGASEGDMKLLTQNRFIIPFESGIVVIKHWYIHNYIRSDRYKETVYINEKNMLEIKENKAYTEVGMTVGTPMVCIDKNRVDKSRVDKSSTEKDSNEVLALIFKTYEEEIGMVTPILSDDIEYYLTELSKEIIIKAIGEASTRNAKNWKYIKAILDRCIKENIRTMADYESKNKKPTVKEEKTTSKYEAIFLN